MYSNFYNLYKDSMLDKEAGIKEDSVSILLALSLFFGGESISSAAEKTGVNEDTILKNVNNKELVEKAKTMAKEKVDTSYEEDIIARTLFAEAGAESYDGKKAIASVIWQRANKNNGNIVNIIKKPKQFSCWNSGTPKQGKGKSWEDCKKIAKELMSGNFKQTTNATHYFNPSLCNPSWAYFDKAKTKPRPYQDIGHHRFLRIN